MNPWSRPQFNVFRSIEDSSHITVKGRDGKAEEITYNRFNLSFTWNEAKKCWISPQHPGYYLSTRTLRGCLAPANENEPDTSVQMQVSNELKDLFSGSFVHYQLLESDKGKPKVILSCRNYSSKGDSAKHKGVIPSLQKNTRQLSPDSDVNFAGEVPMYTYRVSPKGLVCDSPEGYLYLAYTLFAQGKYKEAIRYLKLGDINRPLSSQGKEIIDWIGGFKDHSSGQRHSICT